MRLYRDGSREVAFSHRRGYFGDGAHLGSEVGGELVHIDGQVAPDARCAGHAGLPAQFPFDSHLARHRGYLVGKGRQRIDHAVDGLGELGDFSLRLQNQLSLQISVGDRGHHLGDATHLCSEVAGHGVHRVCKIFPNAAYAFHVGLPA